MAIFSTFYGILIPPVIILIVWQAADGWDAVRNTGTLTGKGFGEAIKPGQQLAEKSYAMRYQYGCWHIPVPLQHCLFTARRKAYKIRLAYYRGMDYRARAYPSKGVRCAYHAFDAFARIYGKVRCTPSCRRHRVFDSARTHKGKWR